MYINNLSNTCPDGTIATQFAATCNRQQEMYKKEYMDIKDDKHQSVFNEVKASN